MGKSEGSLLPLMYDVFHRDSACVSNKEHLVQFVSAFNRDVQNI